MSHFSRRSGKAAGRPSRFAGRTIVATCVENPRKPGSHGHKAYGLLLAAGGSLRYEEYRRLGGALNHLRWDLDHGFAVIKGTKPRPKALTWAERQSKTAARRPTAASGFAARVRRWAPTVATATVVASGFAAGLLIGRRS